MKLNKYWCFSSFYHFLIAHKTIEQCWYPQSSRQLRLISNGLIQLKDTFKLIPSNSLFCISLISAFIRSKTILILKLDVGCWMLEILKLVIWILLFERLFWIYLLASSLVSFIASFFRVYFQISPNIFPFFQMFKYFPFIISLNIELSFLI